ncbi:hypothetical protein [Baaleninema sp.]|uniref:hypothetical protein n=1 Tax=Baaleninema sp. TaxID=3101197 RepID=UPI003D03EE45
MSDRIPKPLDLNPLAPYEDRMLSALAFFRTKRNRTTQAHHCLSMYLRQSEARIMGEVGFYARACGVEPLQFLELIYQNPDRAEQLIQERLHIDISEVFDDGEPPEETTP